MEPENEPLKKEIPDMETTIFRFYVKFRECMFACCCVGQVRYTVKTDAGYAGYAGSTTPINASGTRMFVLVAC